MIVIGPHLILNFLFHDMFRLMEIDFEHKETDTSRLQERRLYIFCQIENKTEIDKLPQ